MFSTVKGAKKCAKEIKRRLDESGFVFPLNKCQSVIAIAGGFRDWNHLEGQLESSPTPVGPLLFRKRLMAALPEPCASPVSAWLDGEPDEPALDRQTPPRWYRDTFPYLLATATIHRARTYLLRKGSGAGQQLRESMVLGLLLNTHGEDRPVPLLEPDTLAFVIEGAPETLFRAELAHPRYPVELEGLIAAGIVEIGRGVVRVNSPDPIAVTRRVSDSRAGKIRMWSGGIDLETVNLLRDALAGIGVRNALRIADAICQLGSDAYTTASGPVLDLMSQLADEGEVEVFAKLVTLFVTVEPKNADFLKAAIPAKISSRYLARHRGISASRMLTWANSNPGWQDSLKSAVERPAAFSSVVNAMAEAMAA
ncbi:hypothetical protein [Mesorhizobium dulcispinae]|uniref:hypothetical protein n=1 Tax=Mesorhizobium dulcispinae TaxID=3072316 RepID=UPI002A24BDA1|nr:hypothetical protein [Mesorhizobium sp. VK23D]MDX8522076.1 hypothetical protein [Mesorhizobium sp. VK23D]